MNIIHCVHQDMHNYSTTVAAYYAELSRMHIATKSYAYSQVLVSSQFMINRS